MAHVTETEPETDDFDEIEGFSEFYEQHAETALWSSTDDAGNPLDDEFGEIDLSRECRAQMRRDCRDFLESNRADIGDRFWLAGHDFWLTRNGHGAGFWDGDWPEPAASRLTAASKAYGGVDLMAHGGEVHC